jgi:hypothetical protein
VWGGKKNKVYFCDREDAPRKWSPEPITCQGIQRALIGLEVLSGHGGPTLFSFVLFFSGLFFFLGRKRNMFPHNYPAMLVTSV